MRREVSLHDTELVELTEVHGWCVKEGTRTEENDYGVWSYCRPAKFVLFYSVMLLSGVLVGRKGENAWQYRSKRIPLPLVKISKLK